MYSVIQITTAATSRNHAPTKSEVVMGTSRGASWWPRIEPRVQNHGKALAVLAVVPSDTDHGPSGAPFFFDDPTVPSVPGILKNSLN